MIQQTVSRIEPLVPRERILIVTGADQAAATRAQLSSLPAENVVAEPARATPPPALAWPPASSEAATQVPR